MFERFTDRARRVVVFAKEEGRHLNHNYIGTEHILLGLLHEGDGVAAEALGSLGVSLATARERVEDIIGRGDSPPAGHVPFTPRAKKVLELSLREAKQLGHDYIGTEHILLGIVREGRGVGARVLVELGADAARVRGEVLRRVGSRPAAGEEAQPEAAAVTGFAVAPGDPVGRWDPALGPVCPRCRSPLVESAASRVLLVSEDDDPSASNPVAVVFCSSCGGALGAFPPRRDGAPGAAPS